MKQFIYNNYTLIIVLSFVIALIATYAIYNYNTGFFGGLVTGNFIALAIGLLVTPKSKFLK